MTTFSNKKSIGKLFAIGLLITALTQLISRNVQVPDFVQGSLIGVGIGIEIVALFMMKRLSKAKQIS